MPKIIDYRPKPGQMDYEPRTPTEMHRFIIERLMEDPNNEPEIIRDDNVIEEYVRPLDPPDFVKHVLETNTQASSGEFHVYRVQRKFEHRRVKFFENQLKEEKAQLEFDEKKKKLAQLEDAKTAERRTKRIQKRKKADDRRKLHRKFSAVLAEHKKEQEDNYGY